MKSVYTTGSTLVFIGLCVAMMSVIGCGNEGKVLTDLASQHKASNYEKYVEEVHKISLDKEGSLDLRIMAKDVLKAEITEAVKAKNCDHLGVLKSKVDSGGIGQESIDELKKAVKACAPAKAEEKPEEKADAEPAKEEMKEEAKDDGAEDDKAGDDKAEEEEAGDDKAEEEEATP